MNEKWDKRFLRLALEISTWSKDPSTKVGAVLVSPDQKDVFFGYNGFPSGLEDTEERLNDREQRLHCTIHAEVNAILNAKRKVDDFTAYTTFVPCDACALQLIQAGISTVVTIEADEELQKRWADKINRTHAFFEEAGIELIYYTKDDLNEEPKEEPKVSVSSDRDVGPGLRPLYRPASSRMYFD